MQNCNVQGSKLPQVPVIRSFISSRFGLLLCIQSIPFETQQGVEVLDEFAEDSKRSNSPVTDYPQLRDINYPQQQQQYRQDA
eukprot:scaffold276396_cov17-Tisochrysis_lutea.AAC.1